MILDSSLLFSRPHFSHFWGSLWMQSLLLSFPSINPKVICFKHSHRTLGEGASLPMAQLWRSFIIHPWTCQPMSWWSNSYHSSPVLGLRVTPCSISCQGPRHLCLQWIWGLFQALHSPEITWFHFPKLLTRNPGEVGVQCWDWVTSDANFLLIVNCFWEIRLCRPFVTHFIWNSQKLFVVYYNKVINVAVYYILIYFLDEGIKVAKQLRSVNFLPQSIIRNAFYCNPVQKNVWRERERQTDRQTR